jgi:hypothetical protein
LHFDWDARIIDGEPGRLVIYVTPEIGIHLVIRQTNPDNYIRNIRVIMPGFEEVYQEQPFHPTYIEFLRQFSVLRLMDWAEINSSSPRAWSQRITPQHATYGSTDGVALEHIIALANTVGRDAWFTVPHLATDEYVQNMAAMIRDQLDPDLRTYIEYSNEVWNADYSQHAYAVEQGLAQSLAAGDTEAIQQFQFFGAGAEGFTAALRFHAQRSVEIFALFEQVFGSRQRFVRVLGGWAPDGLELARAVAGEIIGWQDAGAQADFYAVAPYFGWHLAQADYADEVEAMSVDEVLDAATVEMRLMIEVGSGLQEYVAAQGLKLITYEAGQGMVDAGATPFNITPTVEKIIAANRDPRMYDIYSEYINGWYEFSGLMTLFNDIQAFRSWGLLERWDQDIATAPKYRAVRDFLLTTPEDPDILYGDGDVDGDVDLADFFLFADAFGGTDPHFDYNADGIIDYFDLFILADFFGQVR